MNFVLILCLILKRDFCIIQEIWVNVHNDCYHGLLFCTLGKLLIRPEVLQKKQLLQRLFLLFSTCQQKY